MPEAPILAVDRHGAASALAISVATVDRLVCAGELRPAYIGAAVRFPLAELERFLAAKSDAPPKSYRVTHSRASQ